jgi:hypothetical protein
MIQKHYAVHLKHTLNAAAINVRRPRPAAARRVATSSSRKLGKRKPLGEMA